MFKKFQLKNGLKVLFVESKKSPVVSVQMWVKTGSADELKGEEGISHFIEHLLFKGTRKFKVGEIASTVEGSGGELNAYTSFDQTVFYITISKHFADTALEAVSDMMGFPLFDQMEVDHEREVVIEEIKRGQDNPYRQASQLLFSTAFKKHPYGVPIIGYDKVIKKISRKAVINYYQSRYLPQNMTLLVIGDFELKDMKKKVESYFSELKKFKLKRPKRQKELKQERSRVKVKKTAFEESLLNISWKTPGIKHRDIPALEALALILGQGDSSRLTQKLRIEKPLVNFVGSSCFTPIEPGLFTISLSTTRKNLMEVTEVISGELEKILSEPPHGEELRKALVNLASEEFYSMETVDGMAQKFGSYEHLYNDYKYFNEFMKSVYSLTPEEILRVSRKYLKTKTMTVVMTTPRDEKSAEKLLKKWVKSLHMPKKTQQEKAFTYKKLPRLRWKISNSPNKAASFDLPVKQKWEEGVLILRMAHETPVVNLRCGFRGGLRLEPEGKTGLTELLSRSWVTATKKYSEMEIYHSIESIAAGLSAFGGRNTVGLSIIAMSTYLDKALELFESVLIEPIFLEEVVEREKVVMIEQIKNRNDHPAQVAILGFMEKMFESHPYGRDPLGDEKSIMSLTSEDLLSHYRKMVCRKNFVGVSSGDFDEKSLNKKLVEYLDELPKGEAIRDHFEFKLLTENIYHFEKSDKEQTHIVYGFPGLTFTEKRRYTLQVLQSILAGQGGRLFIELRDKSSLAYSVAPLRMEGIDAGYFGAYIGCSPEKGSKAISMMKQEFEKICDTLVSDLEMDRAKRYLIGRHDIGLQKNSSVTNSILFDEIYGVGYKEIYRYADCIESVTSENVCSLAQDLFSQSSVISAVGRECPW